MLDRCRALVASNPVALSNEAPHSRAVGYLMSQATEVALTIACPNRSRATGYNEYDKV